MSKFTGRINKLLLRTHVFISPADNSIVRDYYKARFDESEKPENFDERYKQLQKLEEEYIESGKEELWEEWKEFIDENPSVWFKFRYLSAVEVCKSFPRGVLLDKERGESFKRIISEARDYFITKSKKKFGRF